MPHGGFITSCFLAVAKFHFNTTRLSYSQPHTIALQLQFLRRSSKGPARLTVSELKLGRRTSTIHISLSHGEENVSPTVVGYLTQSNLAKEVGMSLDTAYALHPSPPAPPSAEALRDGFEPNWVLAEKKFSKFRKAGGHVKTYLPRQGQVGQALIDQWLSFENGEPFTQEALGYLVDTFPQIMESANGQEDLENEMKELQAQSSGALGCEAERPGESRAALDKAQWAHFWYPTVTLNMDIKKLLPSEGVEWLFSRVRAKRIKDGRMDLEVTVLDEEGDIVALSTHVALIVGAERNMISSAHSGNTGNESKL